MDKKGIDLLNRVVDALRNLQNDEDDQNIDAFTFYYETMCNITTEIELYLNEQENGK